MSIAIYAHVYVLDCNRYLCQSKYMYMYMKYGVTGTYVNRNTSICICIIL